MGGLLIVCVKSILFLMTEDDTFNRLKRIPYSGMRTHLHKIIDTTSGKVRTYEEFLKIVELEVLKYGWSLEDIRSEINKTK